MNFSPATPPYDFEHPHQQRIKRLFESIDQVSVNRSAVVEEHNQPPSPPDLLLLHDSEEDDEDSLCTPSLSLKQQQQQQQQGFDHDLKNRSYSSRRKSVPHRSPSVVQDVFQASLVDKSVVFQLNVEHTHTTESSSSSPTNYATNQSCPDCGDTCDLMMKCTCKVICGQSLLSALRKRVAHARSNSSLPVQDHPVRMSRRNNKRTRTASFIEIPRQHCRRNSSASSGSSSSSTDASSSSPNTDTNQTTVVMPEPHHKRPWVDEPQQIQQQYIPQPIDYEDDHHQVKRVKKSSNTTPPRRQSSTHGNSSSSGRPSRVKGPCQACQEASDGCMRKAFNWPFPASQIFNDKGKPFVYLCNKCGLRYNKSGGCVCHNCRWVFCKEEKRKALQHIDAMRRHRPDGYVDPNEDIEHFVCSPKYWTCGKPWKVGWVLNNLEEEDETTDHIVSSPASAFDHAS